jgi:chemotaxis protein histidine kinase CheA
MSTIADLQSTATSNRLNNIREHVISAVNWCGRQVSQGGKFLSNLTTKVALVFANLKKNPIDSAKNNKTFTAVTVLLAIGTISFLVVKLAKVCLNSKKPVKSAAPSLHGQGYVGSQVNKIEARIVADQKAEAATAAAKAAAEAEAAAEAAPEDAEAKAAATAAAAAAATAATEAEAAAAAATEAEAAAAAATEAEAEAQNQ